MGETTMNLVEDGALFGPRQLDMGNSRQNRKHKLGTNTIIIRRGSMRKLILAAITAVVLATLLIPAASAATKTTDTTTDIDFTVPNFAGLCGGPRSGTITQKGSSKSKTWDNGHSVLTVKLAVTVKYTLGAVIGEGRLSNLLVRGEGSSPTVTRINLVINCSDGSQEILELNFTRDENRETHLHG